MLCGLEPEKHRKTKIKYKSATENQNPSTRMGKKEITEKMLRGLCLCRLSQIKIVLNSINFVKDNL